MRRNVRSPAHARAWGQAVPASRCTGSPPPQVGCRTLRSFAAAATRRRVNKRRAERHGEPGPAPSGKSAEKPRTHSYASGASVMAGYGDHDSAPPMPRTSSATGSDREPTSRGDRGATWRWVNGAVPKVRRCSPTWPWRLRSLASRDRVCLVSAGVTAQCCACLLEDEVLAALREALTASISSRTTRACAGSVTIRDDGSRTARAIPDCRALVPPASPPRQNAVSLCQ